MKQLKELLDEKHLKDLVTIVTGYEGTSGLNKDDNKYYPVHEAADESQNITIGIGHLLTSKDKLTKRFEKGLTYQQVLDLFYEDLTVRANYVADVIKPRNQQEFVTILSSYYNCPAIWASHNSPIKHYRNGFIRLCLERFMLYFNSAGKPRLGLVRRRATEALYMVTGQILFGNRSVEEEQKLYTELRKYVTFSLAKFKLRKGVK